MRVTVTTAATDRRMVLPADLVAAPFSLTLADAQKRVDAASAMIASAAGLGWDPWRQVYSLRRPGTDAAVMPLWAKPVESVSSVTDIDGAAVDATDYSVISNGTGILDRLERTAGWASLFGGATGISLTPAPESERDAWIVAYTAGWLMPGQVGAWSASTAYTAETASVSYGDARGSWVRATDRRIVLRFQCTAAGTTGAAEPAAFATAAAGDEVTDGTVTWTARAAHELPADLSEAALELALVIHRQRQRDQAVLSMSAPGSSVKYGEQIPESIAAVIRGYR